VFAMFFGEVGQVAMRKNNGTLVGGDGVRA
jgi:hypothetical protein